MLLGNIHLLDQNFDDGLICRNFFNNIVYNVGTDGTGDYILKLLKLNKEKYLYFDDRNLKI